MLRALHAISRRAASTSPAMGKVTHVTASNASEFDAAIAAHRADDRLVVLFTGATDANTGVSWCPDCNDAKPVLADALAAAEDPVTLITVPLVRSEYSGVASHWARQHPSVKLQRIPSLFRWAGKRPSNALVEGQCMVGKDVRELINADE